MPPESVGLWVRFEIKRALSGLWGGVWTTHWLSGFLPRGCLVDRAQLAAFSNGRYFEWERTWGTA